MVSTQTQSDVDVDIRPTVSPEGVCKALLLFNTPHQDQADRDTPLKANILLNSYHDSLMVFQQMSEDAQGGKRPQLKGLAVVHMPHQVTAPPPTL